MEKERYRLWIIVLAGNDPDGDVAGLTRGALSTADVERLMTSTEANLVKNPIDHPAKLGILGTLLDAKILYMPTTTALAVSREFGSAKLTENMRNAGMTLKCDDALDRLKASSLARAFERASVGMKTTGRPPGPNSREAFGKLAEIARADDRLLNEAFATALLQSGIVDDANLEQEVSTKQSRKTDIACATQALGPVRLEMMWRTTTSRAEVANYTLTKLYNYEKAIGFFERNSANGPPSPATTASVPYPAQPTKARAASKAQGSEEWDVCRPDHPPVSKQTAGPNPKQHPC